LRRLSKKEITGVEDENFPSLLFDLGDKGSFLGNTAKRVSKSPTGLDLTHHIIGVEDAELIPGLSLGRRVWGQD